MFKTLLLILLLISRSQLSEAQLSTLVPVKGNYLYAARAEVSNKEYLSFLASIKTEEKRQALTPDTLVWIAKNTFNEPFVETYLRHPAYSDYPLAGVDHSRAMAYCAWLEEEYNQVLTADAKDPRKKVQVRLPTVQEWETAARGGLEATSVPTT